VGNSEPDENVYIVTGPTASGKSDVGLELAEMLNAEIISADSMQIYRMMDIGTAKLSAEERERVPHHLIDIVWPWESYSAGQFVADAKQCVEDIAGRGRIPLVVGGTALYLQSLTRGLFEGPPANEELRAKFYRRAEEEGVAALHRELAERDPVAAKRIHPNDLRRIVRALEVCELTGKPFSSQLGQWNQASKSFCVFILERRAEDLRRRIERRTKKMLEDGLVQEVLEILAADRPVSHTATQAVGYRQVFRFLAGELGKSDLANQIVTSTWRLVRKQRTWFQHFEGERVLVEEMESSRSVAERILRKIESGKQEEWDEKGGT